jgi:hypothetical protein
MRQSTTITVAIIVGFIIYTTMKGNLVNYMKVIGVA